MNVATRGNPALRFLKDNNVNERVPTTTTTTTGEREGSITNILRRGSRKRICLYRHVYIYLFCEEYIRGGYSSSRPLLRVSQVCEKLCKSHKNGYVDIYIYIYYTKSKNCVLINIHIHTHIYISASFESICGIRTKRRLALCNTFYKTKTNTVDTGVR